VNYDDWMVKTLQDLVSSLASANANLILAMLHQRNFYTLAQHVSLAAAICQGYSVYYRDVIKRRKGA
jgi:hypothetical protein